MNHHSNTIYVPDNPHSYRDIYDYVNDVAIEEIVTRLENMIASADTFDGWILSVKDGNRLIKILTLKKRIIKSSFKFQLKKSFSEFKSIPKTRFDKNLDRDRYSLKLAGVDTNAERLELESIISYFEETYRDFYDTSILRLQLCLQRSHISSTENPLHVKRLYEAFQYSLDNLDLESKFQIALYRLFAHFVVTELTTTYDKIDTLFVENGILPDLLNSESESENLETSTKIEHPLDFDLTGLENPVEVETHETQQTRAEIEPPADMDLTGQENPVQVETHETQQTRAEIEPPADMELTGLEDPVEVETHEPQQTRAEIEHAVDMELTGQENPVQVETQEKQPDTAQFNQENRSISGITEDTSLLDESSTNQVNRITTQPISEVEIKQVESKFQAVEQIDHAANILKGDWVEINQGSNSILAKLVWKAKDGSLLIFIDNNGNRIREINGNQFNKELESNSIGLLSANTVKSKNRQVGEVQEFKGSLTSWKTG